jgi:uncharacterized protein
VKLIKKENTSNTNPAERITWHEWGDSAFEIAKQQKLPIFLYIYTTWGYSVNLFNRDVICDSDVIALASDKFIPVKVDASRYPDIAERYNQGGWPSICFLTTSGELLHGRLNCSLSTFKNIATQVSEYYAENYEEVSERVNESQEQLLPRMKDLIVKDQVVYNSLDRIRQDAFAYYDVKFSGFGGSPKLPLPDLLLFLLEDDNEELNRIAILTIDTIRTSQIHDMIGGGFFKYCEDEAWRDPALEKLLYDNVALLEVFSTAYQLTGEEAFKETAVKTASFLEGALGDESGLLYCALDSESLPGEKGDYYSWSADEIIKALDDEEKSSLFLKYTGISLSKLDFDKFGGYLLQERVQKNQVAMQTGLNPEQANEIIEEAILKLRVLRSNRKEPSVDASFYTGALGRAIRAFASSSIILDSPRLLQRAFEIADIIWKNGRYPDGGIVHEINEKSDTIYLDDQVEVILGYLELYRISGRAKDLENAERIAEDCFILLQDGEGIGCFDHLARDVEFGAMKALYTPFEGNSKLQFCTSLLSAYTQEQKWHERSLALLEGLEALRPSYKLRDANYGRALRRVVQPPLMVDIISGENVGQVRKKILLESPIGTLVRSFDKAQKCKWMPADKYKLTGRQTEMVVYSNNQRHENTSDVDVAISHLKEKNKVD